MQDITEFHKMHVQVGKEMVAKLKSNKDIVPMIAVEKDGKLTVFALDASDDTGRAIQAVLQFAKSGGADRVSVITMGWSVSKSKKEMKDYVYGDLSRDPNREEVLSVTTADKQHHQMFTFGKIIRNKNGDVITIIDMESVANVSGRAVPKL